MKNVSSVPSSIAGAAAKLAKAGADIISGANNSTGADTLTIIDLGKKIVSADKTTSTDTKTICAKETISANETTSADKTNCADETIRTDETIGVDKTTGVDKIGKMNGGLKFMPSISVARSHFVFTCFLRMALLLTLVACCGNLFSPSVLVIMALEGAPTHSAAVSSSFPMRLSYGLLTAVDAYTTPPSTVLASIDKVTNDIADKEGHGGNEPSAITPMDADTPGTLHAQSCAPPDGQCNGDYKCCKGSCSVETVAGWGHCKSLDDVTRFIDVPRMMTHDSATGYSWKNWHAPALGIPSLKSLNGGCNSYPTQTIPFASQLACGARVLDYRPFYPVSSDFDTPADGWRFWHGPGAAIPKEFCNSVANEICQILDWISDETVTVKSTATEILEWAAENPDEIVTLLVSHCNIQFVDYDMCQGYHGTHDIAPGVTANIAAKSVASVLSASGIFVADCKSFTSSTTVADVKKWSKLAGGGHVIAIIDPENCQSGNANQQVLQNNAGHTVECTQCNRHLMSPGEFHKCNTNRTSNCLAEMDKVIQQCFDDSCHSTDGSQPLWEFQAIWQAPGFTPLRSEMDGLQLNVYTPILVWDIQQENFITKLNQHLATHTGPYIKKKQKGGFWMLNNVCVNGMEFAKSIGTHISSQSEQQCMAACRAVEGISQCNLPAWGKTCYWHQGGHKPCWVRDNLYTPKDGFRPDCSDTSAEWCCASNGAADCNYYAADLECAEGTVTQNSILVPGTLVPGNIFTKPWCPANGAREAPPPSCCTNCPEQGGPWRCIPGA